MELQICLAGEWRPAALGGSAGVSSDVLAGRDCEVGWEDVFKGMLAVDFEKGERGDGANVRFRRSDARGARLPCRDGAEAEDELVRWPSRCIALLALARLEWGLIDFESVYSIGIFS